MGNIWLLNAPTWLRQAGLTVVEEDGWELRSRSSGGFDEVMGIGLHHDAANIGTPLENRVGWEYHNSPDKPVGNMHLHTDGVIVFGAAGASNTMGKGGPYTTSRGVIPKDQGNKYIFAIEASNNGVGEVWPDLQSNVYEIACAVLCHRLGLQVKTDIMSHFEWTTRKIDPWGPSRYAGYDEWDMNMFRQRVLNRLLPPPPETSHEMLLYRHPAYADVFLVGAGALHVGPAIAEAFRNQGVPEIVVQDWIELEYIMQACGFDPADLTEL